MEKLKLELKHIASYPIGMDKGLGIQTKTRLSSREGEKLRYRTGKLVGISDITGVEILFNIEDWVEDYELYEIKPILRPLSDLIKEIEVDGKKFIPLVEIAKTALCDTTKIVGPSKTKTDYGVMFDVENDDDSFKHEVFAYSHEIKMFGRHYRTYPHYEHTSQILFVPNQLELFEKLYEWHFDIHGLIDSGLAVDINTLSE